MEVHVKARFPAGTGTPYGVKKDGEVVDRRRRSRSAWPDSHQRNAPQGARLARGFFDVCPAALPFYADAFPAAERLEAKLEATPGHWRRASVGACQAGRTDKYSKARSDAEL